MKMISLPNGKFINPAQVDSVKVHAHSLSWSKFYVQMSLKDGSTEDIAESLNHEKASALQSSKMTARLHPIDAGIFSMQFLQSQTLSQDSRSRWQTVEDAKAKDKIVRRAACPARER